MVPQIRRGVDNVRSPFGSPLDSWFTCAVVVILPDVRTVPVHYERDKGSAVGGSGAGPEVDVHHISAYSFHRPADAPLHPGHRRESRLLIQRTHAFRKPGPVPPWVSGVPSVLDQSPADVGAVEKVDYFGIGHIAPHGTNVAAPNSGREISVQCVRAGRQIERVNKLADRACAARDLLLLLGQYPAPTGYRIDCFAPGSNGLFGGQFPCCGMAVGLELIDVGRCDGADRFPE
jgi:hypothetical protein